MKIQVDGEDVFELEDWEELVIKNDIPSDLFVQDMKRRLEWVLKHKAEQCYITFEKEWIDKLRTDSVVTSIPTDKRAFVKMVIARPDYKDRAARDTQ